MQLYELHTDHLQSPNKSSQNNGFLKIGSRLSSFLFTAEIAEIAEKRLKKIMGFALRATPRQDDPASRRINEAPRSPPEANGVSKRNRAEAKPALADFSFAFSAPW
jgi:hypothetical protein